jgi:two-component system, NarL family, invasion response regulator UvrY
MIRILIVDDHAIVGGGLKQFLGSVGGFEIGGEARTGAEALAMVMKEQWDLLLLDIGLPDINGIEVMKQIKRNYPKLPVLVFSMYTEDEYALTALEAGAVGYLPKDSAPDEILAAIRRASLGERYLSPTLAEKLINGIAVSVKKLPHEALSARESDVMCMLSQGLPLTEIGERLHLSPKTVSTYRARILDKLGLRHNADITRYALKHKISQ